VSAVTLPGGAGFRQGARLNVRARPTIFGCMSLRAPARNARRRAAHVCASAGLLLVSGLVTACGGAPKPAPAPVPAAATGGDTATVRAATPAPTPATPAAPVFGDFATRKVVVFPLQKYAVGDSGWLAASSATGRPRAAQLDSALTSVLRDRGLETTWSLAPNTSRVAQREVMNRTDPRALSTAGLGPSRRRNDIDLREPLSSQLRAIIAMVPESRMVLLPLETRVVTTASGQRQATLRLAFLDGRMATVLSFPDVVGAPSADEKSALQSAATKFADLVIIP
jgi:hypothetical protein